MGQSLSYGSFLVGQALHISGFNHFGMDMIRNVQ
jgi:hypothetical protein